MPDCFSPSALANSAGCRLRLVIASQDRSQSVERLPTGPEAAVGTLLHRVLERISRESATSPQQIFRQEYERTVIELRADPGRAHFAELASTRSMNEWSRVRAWALARTTREVMPRVTPSGNGLRHRSTIGSEIRLESLTMRLRGKADRIKQMSSRVIEIRDFKTGVTINEQGEIKREISLQLQAYGLILLEQRPGYEVRLVVDDGDEREIPFDAQAQRDAKAAIERIVCAMPAAGNAAAIELATPGSSCFSCPIRHNCPAYHAIAPIWWKQYPADITRLSNDVWGTVVDVIGESPCDIKLHDVAGRHVRIDGVDTRHGITSSALGEKLWFFGLEATGPTRGFNGANFHPRVFHELPRDGLERRAWAAQVFLDS